LWARGGALLLFSASESDLQKARDRARLELLHGGVTRDRARLERVFRGYTSRMPLFPVRVGSGDASHAVAEGGSATARRNIEVTRGTHFCAILVTAHPSPLQFF